ncbi:MAG: aminoacyl-tRNA hydrolase [Treponema sp.]|nr:aminoacyl-tRNA hydrolase [Treponema sp.]
MLQLVAFLGNPGLQYQDNRHNAGWMLSCALPFSSSLKWKKKFNALYAFMDGIHFLKPQVYMNRSGESVAAAASFYKIKLDSIIVVHDEIELPFGFVSLKFSGGLGGHNGLRSIKACCGSADFWRLRLGIGRPDGRIPGKGGSLESSQTAGIADWVLSGFSPIEAEAFEPVLKAGADVLTKALSANPENLLPEWSKKSCL